MGSVVKGGFANDVYSNSEKCNMEFDFSSDSLITSHMDFAHDICLSHKQSRSCDFRDETLVSATFVKQSLLCHVCHDNVGGNMAQKSYYC